MTITVLYSCDLCGLKRIPLEVKARDEEDVVTWMDNVVMLLGLDHRRRSPHCHPKSLTNVMIPMTGSTKIGGPVVQ